MSQRKSPKKKKQRGGYQSPGVYVEEVSSGSKPIEGVGTAVAALVRSARRQPVRAATVLLLPWPRWSLWCGRYVPDKRRGHAAS